ncbi:MAG TPA: O-antigen ligase family protein [Thermoanaerobaculia bacterium]|nr:O-antigen ligase family protein [Thermoanaerobaculia bacterium]
METSSRLAAAPAGEPLPAPGELAECARRAQRDRRWQRLAYWGYALHLFTIFGIALSNILLGLTLLAAPRALLARRVRWSGLEPILVPMGFYLVFLFAAIALSFEPRTSWTAAGDAFALATLFLGPGLVRGERQARRLIDGLIVVAALLAVKGLSQYLTGYGELERRIRGPFSHYMTFSGVLLICDVLLLTALAFSRERRQLWRWAALLAINAALVGTLTRGAWVALGLTLAALLFLRSPRSLVWCVPAAMIVVLMAPARVLHRVVSIFDLRDDSNYDRLCMIDAGLHMVAERPLVGLGPDMVDYRYEIYRQPTAPRYWVPHLHNSFLELAAERGLPELAAYLWMMATALLLAARRYRAEGGLAGPRADFYLGCILALVAFNLAGLFENNWGDAEVKRLALFVMMLPFCLELADGERREQTGDRSEPAGGATSPA